MAEPVVFRELVQKVRVLRNVKAVEKFHSGERVLDMRCPDPWQDRDCHMSYPEQ